MRTTAFLSMLALSAAAPGQPLSLREAARLALARHPSIEAGEARVKAAESRIDQARSGLRPKVNYSESYLRGNNPVYVFSSLLTQRQFGEQNFQIGPLNRPDALNNFQSQLTVEQPIYDAGQVRQQTRSAQLGRGLAQEDRRRTGMTLIAAVVRNYHGAVLAQESLNVAREAVRSAEADLARAEAVRAAGMSTDADVLSIRVHLAAMREQEIRRGYDLSVARAALNEALGLPMDTPHELSTPLTLSAASAGTLAEYEDKAARERPEARQVRLAAELAETQSAAARSALKPQVGFRGALEADRQRFVTRGGGNWLIAATLRWNLFNGLGDKARIEEASHALAGARAEQRQTEAGIRLQVRRADADRKGAGERIAVADAAVAMAEESLRITKNRYENGLNTVTDLLRNETALLEARTRRLAAIHDSRVATAALELAAGTLSLDSEILQ
ncbi:MAG: TolC family protein [Acidobacteria bacterium]|nr:TolC family protein [Acidobacteriota bacterium]MBI3473800.1 TolC family protein [Candidatus Solibacter usitatus]